MDQAQNIETGIKQATEDLFDFAVDRDDVKTLLANLPEDAKIERGKVEYELAILRIISVGWSIAYFPQDATRRERLTACYWEAVREFSQTISTSAGLLAGKEIDYFQILKDRLNTYLEAMRLKPDAPRPAAVIAPEFARVCGNVNDVNTVMVGARMFMSVISRVKAYLAEMKL